MPNYDYECADCGEFTLLRPISERGNPVGCPHCGGSASRVMSVPQFALMDNGTRKGMEVNERSRHAPRERTAHSCSSGCGCGSGRSVKPTRTVERKIDTKRHTAYQLGGKGSRPWMLGH